MNKKPLKLAKLILEDGTEFTGSSFGYEGSTAGEVVFNTGMVGYPETLTDPSYCGQILTLTYPLIGNYGVPADTKENGLKKYFESEKIQIQALVVNEYCDSPSHHQNKKTLAAWLKEYKIPAIQGVDTRALTKKLRSHGVMLGKIIIKENLKDFVDPNENNLIAEVSRKKVATFGKGKYKVIAVDSGIKNNIIRSLAKRDVTIKRVPWDYDFTNEKFHGLFLSNGPGDPVMAAETIANIRKNLKKNIPIFGICMGLQLLALAAGAKTYKMKFGHRSQNQPCLQLGTKKCYITSQNHGYAVRPQTLPKDWKIWFENANDHTIEGIKHKTKPFMAVQFHPEATPGPTDTAFLFDEFIKLMKKRWK